MDPDKLTVYFDGACPKCRRDRENLRKLAGTSADLICWFDITGQDQRLRDLGIDPQKALSELHVRETSSLRVIIASHSMIARIKLRLIDA